MPVSVTVTELSRLTNYSRRHVHEALHEAMKRGYIERMSGEYHDSRVGARSQGATYRIRWTAQAVNPVSADSKAPRPQSREAAASFTFLNSSKKVNAQPVQNGEWEEYKMVNAISIKRSIKNRSTAAADQKPPAAAADEIIAKLLAVGFDVSAAGQLASRWSVEVIEQQLAWLPQRKADRNRLGLLRRAIEENWPPPEASGSPPEHAAGAIFVGHFEAALHGYTEPPARCSPKEAEHAAGFLRELARATETELPAAEWGRRFGQFIRAKAPAKPWFIWVLRMHGSEFLRECRRPVRSKSRSSIAQSRQAHEELFTARYHDYLRAIESGFQRDQPALHATFEAHRHENMDDLNLTEATRARLASETSRLAVLVGFLREHGVPVLEFWEWDRRLNPEGCPS